MPTINNSPTLLQRIASTFQGGVWIRPRIKKTETGTGGINNQGARDMVRLTITASENQTSDNLDVTDYQGNILLAIGAGGNISYGGVPAVVQAVDQVVLTAAQITTLHSVPVSLIAAPGAGIALVVTAMTMQFKYGSVQFTGGGAVNPVYHGATTNLLSGAVAAATITGAANATISAGAPAAALGATTNVGVDLLAATQDFAAGNSTAIVTVWYSLVTLG